MKAAFIEQTGPPHVIQYDDLPTPTVTGAQVLVRVEAVAVNPIDTYIRGGANFFELPWPYILGCDVAGVVEQVGPEASRWQVGERIWGSNQGVLGRQGTFAEFALVDPCWLYPIPENVTDQSAAAMALVGITAHLGLFGQARLTANDTIFVNGGSGGVGSTVVQMAKRTGASVITTAGSDVKVADCLQLGADHAINYKTADVAESVREITPDGVNVYWETVREPDLERAVNMLAKGGRLILMAGRTATPPFPIGPFYAKGCSAHGFVMFAASAEEQARGAHDINQWMAEGTLVPRIDRVLPLSETAEAHRIQEESTVANRGTLAGKIVLTP